MTLVLDGTLDAHSRADLKTMSAREGAVRHFGGELARYRGQREWWRIATLPQGEPIGFVIPGRNGYGAIIGYIGVLPAQRGTRVHRRDPRRGRPRPRRAERAAHPRCDGPG
jgi:hypothetical protein